LKREQSQMLEKRADTGRSDKIMTQFLACFQALFNFLYSVGYKTETVVIIVQNQILINNTET
jgi:hypothetical protein